MEARARSGSSSRNFSWERTYARFCPALNGHGCRRPCFFGTPLKFKQLWEINEERNIEREFGALAVSGSMNSKHWLEVKEMELLINIYAGTACCCTFSKILIILFGNNCNKKKFWLFYAKKWEENGIKCNNPDMKKTLPFIALSYTQ